MQCEFGVNIGDNMRPTLQRLGGFDRLSEYRMTYHVTGSEVEACNRM